MSEVLRNLTEKEANEMKADLKKCGCGLFSDYDLGPYDIHEGISNPIMSSVGGAKYNDQGMWIPARDIARFIRCSQWKSNQMHMRQSHQQIWPT